MQRNVDEWRRNKIRVRRTGRKSGGQRLVPLKTEQLTPHRKKIRRPKADSVEDGTADPAPEENPAAKGWFR